MIGRQLAAAGQRSLDLPGVHAMNACASVRNLAAWRISMCLALIVHHLMPCAAAGCTHRSRCAIGGVLLIVLLCCVLLWCRTRARAREAIARGMLVVRLAVADEPNVPALVSCMPPACGWVVGWCRRWCCGSVSSCSTFRFLSEG